MAHRSPRRRLQTCQSGDRLAATRNDDVLACRSLFHQFRQLRFGLVNIDGGHDDLV
jgi:hypothetical protein